MASAAAAEAKETKDEAEAEETLVSKKEENARA